MYCRSYTIYMFMGCVLTHGSGPTGKPKFFSQGPNLTQVPEIGPTHVPTFDKYSP